MSDSAPKPMGLAAQAAQNFRDLFRWQQRVTIIDENGQEREEWQSPEMPKNPIKLLRMLSATNWLYYLVGLAAWTVDGYDFHSVSISLTRLSAFYGVSKTQVSTAITLTLLLRSIGAALFGVAGDYWGRKWPMVINMFIIGALQVGTVYARTFNEFLAVRALFGIGMGGIWGGAVSMALENVPTEARGLLSGVLQQGYSLGYVFAALFNLTLAPKGGKHGFRTLFWIGAGASFFVGVVRALFPESKQFLDAKKQNGRGGGVRAFRSQVGTVFRTQWKMMDNYAVFIEVGMGYTKNQSSLAGILMKTGACVGGTIIGYISQFFGRRRTIVLAAVMSGLLIPAWILPKSLGGLMAGGFMLQFFVQGAWGVIPVHLNELSPPAFRASFPGIAYQIGNMISSPSAQIVTAISESHYYTNPNGKRTQAFGPTMAIATAIIALGIAVWVALGTERKGSHFEAVSAATAAVDGPVPHHKNLSDDLETGSYDEKNSKTEVSGPQVHTVTKDAH
ncbi:related to carboxylic acid transport protein [Pseudozyma flocculosa]|uniref:Related to carboxylic acid transport protein n=1 Tax=Pseudozyma flocculosa TaxID=84751 RepID=A0A5C3EY36_9BASI|nr:related to carboxylic acid transport protein [Pseudozyma flocculosa]